MSHLAAAAFIPGLELSGLFFAEVVQPLLAEAFPTLSYGAALLSQGSDVLGFDTPMSTDHDWGPRVDLFLERESRELDSQIEQCFSERLPREFRGYPTSFTPPDPTDNGTQRLDFATTGPIRHKILVWTPARFINSYLAFDVGNPVEPADWLTFPTQRLRTIAHGAIYRDGVGLALLQERFAFYPHDVWLYLLAAGWTRIGQEEHLMGRAGSVGDEIGSAIIGARLVRDLMRLCFLMEREYAPYPKWFGSAFARLRCAPELSSHLRAALAATDWRDRERALIAAYEIVARMHEGLAITPPVSTVTRPFFSRPFQVIALNGFADVIAAQIKGESVRRLLDRPMIGGIDHVSDSTDLLDNPEWRLRLRRLFETLV